MCDITEHMVIAIKPEFWIFESSLFIYRPLIQIECFCTVYSCFPKINDKQSGWSERINL